MRTIISILSFLFLAGMAEAQAPLYKNIYKGAPNKTEKPTNETYFKFTWPDSLSGSNVSSISIDSSGDIYAVAIINNSVQVSTNGGVGWKNSLTGFGVQTSVTAGNCVLVSGWGTGTFIKREDSDSWDPVNDGLPTLAVNALAYSKKNGDCVYWIGGQ